MGTVVKHVHKDVYHRVCTSHQHAAAHCEHHCAACTQTSLYQPHTAQPGARSVRLEHATMVQHALKTSQLQSSHCTTILWSWQQSESWRNLFDNTVVTCKHNRCGWRWFVGGEMSLSGRIQTRATMLHDPMLQFVLVVTLFLLFRNSIPQHSMHMSSFTGGPHAAGVCCP